MEHEDRLQIAAQNLDRAVNDWIVEHGSEQLYKMTTEHGGDPETMEVISWDTETNLGDGVSIVVQKFTVKREEK